MNSVRFDNVLDATNLEPSRLKPDGQEAGAFGRMLDIGAPLDALLNTGVWKAEPGTYRHPGGPTGETFVLLQGEAEIEIAGAGTFALQAGSIISVPPATASVMRVSKTMLKVSMVMKAAAAG